MKVFAVFFMVVAACAFLSAIFAWAGVPQSNVMTGAAWFLLGLYAAGAALKAWREGEQ